MFARKFVQRSALTALAKRRFGSHASHHPEKMTYTEWIDIQTKLQAEGLSAADRNAIQARITEARVSQEQLQFFTERHQVREMTDAEFEETVKQLKASPFAESYPLWAEHQEAVLAADRANIPRPDVFHVSHSAGKTFTPQELGGGNYNQKLFNEYLYELQTCPERATKYNGANQTEYLSIQWTAKQSMVFLLAACVPGGYGAYLYRQMYVEKYNLWDMLNWESRVIGAKAQQERGW